MDGYHQSKPSGTTKVSELAIKQSFQLPTADIADCRLSYSGC